MTEQVDGSELMWSEHQAAKEAVLTPGTSEISKLPATGQLELIQESNAGLFQSHSSHSDSSLLVKTTSFAVNSRDTFGDHASPKCNQISLGEMGNIHIGGDPVSPTAQEEEEFGFHAGAQGATKMDRDLNSGLADLEAEAMFDEPFDSQALDFNCSLVGLEDWTNDDSWTLDLPAPLEYQDPHDVVLPAVEDQDKLLPTNKELACKTRPSSIGEARPMAVQRSFTELVTTPNSELASDFSVFDPAVCPPVPDYSWAIKEGGPASQMPSTPGTAVPKLNLNGAVTPEALQANNPELHPAMALGDTSICTESPKHRVLAEMYGLELSALLSPEAKKPVSHDQCNLQGRPKFSAIVRAGPSLLLPGKCLGNQNQPASSEQQPKAARRLCYDSHADQTPRPNLMEFPQSPRDLKSFSQVCAQAVRKRRADLNPAEYGPAKRSRKETALQPPGNLPSQDGGEQHFNIPQSGYVFPFAAPSGKLGQHDRHSNPVPTATAMGLVDAEAIQRNQIFLQSTYCMGYYYQDTTTPAAGY